MHGHGPNTDFSGIRRMPREIAKFLTSQDWLFGEAAGDRARVIHRRLRIESLEGRQLMDAAGAASLVSSVWFQSVASTAGTAHAGVADWTIESNGASAAQTTASTAEQQNVYDWIVQFNTASLGGVSSVAQTASLLAGGGIQFQIVEGLGMTGMVMAAVPARCSAPFKAGSARTSTSPASSATRSIRSSRFPAILNTVSFGA